MRNHNRTRLCHAEAALHFKPTMRHLLGIRQGRRVIALVPLKVEQNHVVRVITGARAMERSEKQRATVRLAIVQHASGAVAWSVSSAIMKHKLTSKYAQINTDSRYQCHSASTTFQQSESDHATHRHPHRPHSRYTCHYDRACCSATTRFPPPCSRGPAWKCAIWAPPSPRSGRSTREGGCYRPMAPSQTFHAPYCCGYEMFECSGESKIVVTARAH